MIYLPVDSLTLTSYYFSCYFLSTSYLYLVLEITHSYNNSSNFLILVALLGIRGAEGKIQESWRKSGRDEGNSGRAEPFLKGLLAWWRAKGWGWLCGWGWYLWWQMAIHSRLATSPDRDFTLVIFRIILSLFSPGNRSFLKGIITHFFSQRRLKPVEEMRLPDEISCLVHWW